MRPLPAASSPPTATSTTGRATCSAKTRKLGGLSTNVVLSSAYDYNGNRTGLSANVGGSMNGDGTASGGTPDFADTYAYNHLGQMTSILQTRQHDSNGNPVGNAVSPKYVALSYDADGRLKEIDRYPSTGTSDLVATSKYTYDADSRLTKLAYSATARQSGTLPSYRWSYDDDGDVTYEYALADSSSSRASPTSSYTYWARTSYGYDCTGELTSTSYANFANAPADASQTYDYNGNATNNGSPGAANRLLYDGQYYYAYDADGNRTAKFESATGALDSTATNITTYQWNNAGQLTGVSQYAYYTDYQAACAAGSAPNLVSYAYDPFGPHGVGEPGGGAAENFIYDGQNVALVMNAAGQVVERELYGPAVDQILATETVPAGSSPQAAGTVNWLLTDNQGTVRDVVQFANGTTSVVDHLVYDSFGQIASQTTPADQPTFTYDGLWQDPDDRVAEDRDALVRCGGCRVCQPGPAGLRRRSDESERVLRQQPDEWDGPHRRVMEPAQLAGRSH